MRDKLIELIDSAAIMRLSEVRELADYLLAHGVTMQTTPISYERLLKLALKMHRWIFIHCANEEKVYNQLGLTEEENYVFGYGGKIEMHFTEAPKEDTV